MPELHQSRILILADAVRGGGAPGAICRMEVSSPSDLARSCRPLSLHEFGAAEALAEAHALGVLPGRVVLFGMEPARIEPGMALSFLVARRLPEFVKFARPGAAAMGAEHA